jgi:hypothetical protein
VGLETTKCLNEFHSRDAGVDSPNDFAAAVACAAANAISSNKESNTEFTPTAPPSASCASSPSKPAERSGACVVPTALPSIAYVQ